MFTWCDTSIALPSIRDSISSVSRVCGFTPFEISEERIELRRVDNLPKPEQLRRFAGAAPLAGQHDIEGYSAVAEGRPDVPSLFSAACVQVALRRAIVQTEVWPDLLFPARAHDA